MDKANLKLLKGEKIPKNNIPIIMYINQDGNFSIKSDPIENGHDYAVSIPGLVEDIDVVKLSKWFSYSL